MRCLNKKSVLYKCNYTVCVRVCSVLPLLLWYCVYMQAELLTGSSVTNVEEAHRAAQELLQRGCGSVIVTLGPQGCVVLEARDSTSKHVPTTAVTAVDTTVSMTHFCVMWSLFFQLFILVF